MSLEETLRELQSPTVNHIITQALAAAEIPRKEYLKDREAAIKKLMAAGLAVQPIVQPEMPFESRTRVICAAIEHIQPPQFLIIPHEMGVLAYDPWSHIKKARIVLTKSLSDLDKDGTGTNTNWLPSNQLHNLLPHIRPGDNIVGFRFSGNQGIENHVVWLIDLLRATMVYEAIEPATITVASRYYGIGDAYAGPQTSDRRCFTVKFLPSFNPSRKKPYELLLHSVPTFSNNPDHDTLQAVFNLSTRHSCKKDEWYTTKARRLTLSINPESGRRTIASSYSDEKLMCHHIILATYLIEGSVSKVFPGDGVLPVFPRATTDGLLRDSLMPVYKKCISSVIKTK